MAEIYPHPTPTPPSNSSIFIGTTAWLYKKIHPVDKGIDYPLKAVQGMGNTERGEITLATTESLTPPELNAKYLHYYLPCTIKSDEITWKDDCQWIIYAFSSHQHKGTLLSNVWQALLLRLVQNTLVVFG